MTYSPDEQPVSEIEPGTSQVPDPDDLVPCPHCAEPIRRAAQVCRFCQRSVTPRGTELIFTKLSSALSRMWSVRTSPIFLVGLLLVLVAGTAAGYAAWRDTQRAEAIELAKDLVEKERTRDYHKGFSPGEVVYANGNGYVVSMDYFYEDLYNNRTQEHILVALRTVGEGKYTFKPARAIRRSSDPPTRGEIYAISNLNDLRPED